MAIGAENGETCSRPAVSDLTRHFQWGFVNELNEQHPSSVKSRLRLRLGFCPFMTSLRRDMRRVQWLCTAAPPACSRRLATPMRKF